MEKIKTLSGLLFKLSKAYRKEHGINGLKSIKRWQKSIKEEQDELNERYKKENLSYEEKIDISSRLKGLDFEEDEADRMFRQYGALKKARLKAVELEEDPETVTGNEWYKEKIRQCQSIFGLKKYGEICRRELNLKDLWRLNLEGWYEMLEDWYEKEGGVEE